MSLSLAANDNNFVIRRGRARVVVRWLDDEWCEVTAETKVSTVASSDVLRNLDIRRQRDPLCNSKSRKCPSFRIFLHYAPCSF
jgi:hypothetical protein